jgi:hypothetical protein
VVSCFKRREIMDLQEVSPAELQGVKGGGWVTAAFAVAGAIVGGAVGAALGSRGGPGGAIAGALAGGVVGGTYGAIKGHEYESRANAESGGGQSLE